MLTTIKNFLNEEHGVTSVEYAVVAAGIVAIVSVIFSKDGTVATMMTDVFKSITTQVQKIVDGGTTPTPP